MSPSIPCLLCDDDIPVLENSQTATKNCNGTYSVEKLQWNLRRDCISLQSCNRILFLVLLLALSMTTTTLSHQAELLQRCSDKCGTLQVPYPFYVRNQVRANCGPPLSEYFHISCNSSSNSSNSNSNSNSNSSSSSVSNSSDLFLTIQSRSYRVLEFFPDGLLLDFPNSSATTCRRYSNLNSFEFRGNEYLGLSTDNVLDLYDCEDSSICRADCGDRLRPEPCGRPACCFSLSDCTNWSGFPMFGQFGCRGFSSWVVSPDGKASKRGIKLEWAIPSNSSKQVCADNAKIIAASSVVSGVRCQCQDGFVGDGFALGAGCLKLCFKDGKEVYGQDCYAKPHRKRKTEILVGVVTSALTIASLTGIFCLLKRPMKDQRFDAEQIHNSQTNTSFQETYRAQLFNFCELEEATGGFSNAQIISQGTKGNLYAGTLLNGSRIAVHKLQCDGERDLVHMLSIAERLSAIFHPNLARPLGWSIGSSYILLVVYDCSPNGTLKQHMGHSQVSSLEWCERLIIVTETASVLAFLQCEISPPIFHHNLQSGYIFLDEDWSAIVAGFELLLDRNEEVNNMQKKQQVNALGTNHTKTLTFLYEEGNNTKKQGSDVYNLGLVLLEIITGGGEEISAVHHRTKRALQKIRSGKLEEIVDPRLNYHDQREQIEIVADLATRCLLFSGDGKFHMADVARELVQLTKRGHSVLEETFSNSSLLQMISMSPDSIYANC